jgi:GGDEF domain-containing protein
VTRARSARLLSAPTSSADDETPDLDANPATQLHLLDVTLTAQRAMLRARTPDQVVAALELATSRLGGTVAPAHVGGPEAMPLDLGLGVRDPLLPCAAPEDPARARLEQVLPGLVEDATQTVQRLWRLEEDGDPTLLDPLTGALQPAATTRLVTRAAPTAVLAGVAVDTDGAVASASGPARADVLLRDLSRYLRSELDVDERLGRLHGLALVAVLPRPEPARADELLARIGDRWARRDHREEATLTRATVEVDTDPIGALRTLADQLGLPDQDRALGQDHTRSPS